MPQHSDESVSEREEGRITHTSPDISVQSKAQPTIKASLDSSGQESFWKLGGVAWIVFWNWKLCKKWTSWVHKAHHHREYKICTATKYLCSNKFCSHKIRNHSENYYTLQDDIGRLLFRHTLTGSDFQSKNSHHWQW